MSGASTTTVSSAPSQFLTQCGSAIVNNKGKVAASAVISILVLSVIETMAQYGLFSLTVSSIIHSSVYGTLALTALFIYYLAGQSKSKLSVLAKIIQAIALVFAAYYAVNAITYGLNAAGLIDETVVKWGNVGSLVLSGLIIYSFIRKRPKPVESTTPTSRFGCMKPKIPQE